jgi:hypothetical protein
MGLTYHYAFSAPGTTPAAVLEDFLHDVEADAKALGFDPVLVLDAAFDTPERQKFARQLTTGARLESEKLKGVVLLRDGQVWRHDPVTGSCRVIPKRGVVLVVTDAQKRETVFGFFQFPAMLQDLNGRDVVTTHQGERWTFQNFVNSSDPRFRQIVKRFAAAGYLDAERDEFAKSTR